MRLAMFSAICARTCIFISLMLVPVTKAWLGLARVQKIDHITSRDVLRFGFYAVTKTLQEIEILVRGVYEIFLFPP